MSGASHALSNLRAAVIVIVLAFHSCLAYLVSAPAPTAAFAQPPYVWRAFPIVDHAHWLGFDIFCAWQDVSLMALMFFLAGLFTSPSLARKGVRSFLLGRLWRIGVPFALAVVFLSPLAHYPAYSLRTAHPSVADYWQQWFALPFWPSGPEWFLWQLLAITLIAVLVHHVTPRVLEHLDRLASWSCEQPLRLFGAVAAASIVVYVPPAFFYSPWSWSALGPFSFQICRPALYLVFFAAAVAIGRRGLDRGLLTCDGPLARNWTIWLGIAVVTFAIWAGVTGLTEPDWSRAPLAARLGSCIAYAVACPAGVLFLLAAGLHFGRIRSRVLDSLSAEAYGMYLIHYVFVVWLQFALLGSAVPAFVKAAVVLAVALILSWACSKLGGRLIAGLSSAAPASAMSPIHR